MSRWSRPAGRPATSRRAPRALRRRLGAATTGRGRGASCARPAREAPWIPAEVGLDERVGGEAGGELQAHPLGAEQQGESLLWSQRPGAAGRVAVERRAQDLEVEEGVGPVFAGAVAPGAPRVTQLVGQRDRAHRVEVDEAERPLARGRGRAREQDVVELEVTVADEVRQRRQRRQARGAGEDLVGQRGHRRVQPVAGVRRHGRAEPLQVPRGVVDADPHPTKAWSRS